MIDYPVGQRQKGKDCGEGVCKYHSLLEHGCSMNSDWPFIPNTRVQMSKGTWEKESQPPHGKKK